MNEELVEMITEEEFRIETEGAVESEVKVEDLEQSIDVDESVDVVLVETVEEISIEVDEAVGWVGGDSSRHYSLAGRDERDQHPISAITGLRDELDAIEKLQTVYSDKKQHADYYLWEDENQAQDDRIGYFVSISDDINRIKICDGDDVFGVTVDTAAFIGGQDDIARDCKYGLVASTGVVTVRCESNVAVGDYVAPNRYGVATKVDGNCGYKVMSLHDIDGIGHAAIDLGASVCQMIGMSNQLIDISGRMDDAETNIITAMNVANIAYQKSSEGAEISEEALKNALEALDKSESVLDAVDKVEQDVTNANQLAVQAKAIAESAATSAETIRDEAKKASDKTLAEVNDLIKDLEPITTWGDPDGVHGAEYLTTYIRNDLATKAEVSTAETLATNNQSAILKNAQGIETIVSSVDKYSVGEYSQAYGLTYEQAQSILKVGMIYIPTKHADSNNHTETYEGNADVNTFTPGYYYTWDGADWIESESPLVAFFSEVPEPSNILKYWYVDSNDAPDGYEAHALYVNVDDQWTKVNTLAGNVNNRITSMIRQTADKIALDVVNAQESVASHQQWLDDNSANIQDVVSWKAAVETDVSNIATIKQTADDAGASVAQVAAQICGKYTTIEGSWDETDKDPKDVYYTTEDKKYHYYKDGEWKETSYPTEAGLEVNAASIVTAVNNDTSGIAFTADHIDFTTGTFEIDASHIINLESPEIDLKGYVTISDLAEEGKTEINGSNITTGSIKSPNYSEGTSGMKINLDNGTLDSKNLTLDSDGDVSITGDIIAKSGKLENVTLTDTLYFEDKDNTGKQYYIRATRSPSLQIKTFWRNDYYEEWDGQTYPDVRNKTTVYHYNGKYYYCNYTDYYDNTWYETDNPIEAGVCLNKDCVYWAESARNSDSFYYYYYNNGAWQPKPSLEDTGANYINLPHFYVNEDGAYFEGRGEFSGDVYADNGYFKGDITGATGTFSGNLVCSSDDDPETTVTISGGEIYSRYYYATQYFNAGGTSYYDDGVYTYKTGGYVDVLYWSDARDLINNSKSDESLKHSIEPLSDIDKYDALFDKLVPTRYKYNDGTSDRYHTGFIAQQVVEAVEECGLTTKDFAAACYREREDEAYWYLRRDEFVALNTMQIQKLKQRVSELEAKCEELLARLGE